MVVLSEGIWGEEDSKWALTKEKILERKKGMHPNTGV